MPLGRHTFRTWWIIAFSALATFRNGSDGGRSFDDWTARRQIYTSITEGTQDETWISSEWTTALSVCTHILAFISHLLFESHPIFLLAKPIPQILRRWSLDGVPETVLGGTFGGGYDQLKFPRGIVLQGGSALVWFVWSSHNENQLIIDN